MSYEPPEYKTLTNEIWRLEQIKHFVDLARSFEHMKYSGRMTVETAPRMGVFDPTSERLEIEVPDLLKDKLIAAASAWCVEQAKAVASIERKDFEIEQCVKV